jgi:response regulator RpfG family c-di-GMP phosphodiesterase
VGIRCRAVCFAGRAADNALKSCDFIGLHLLAHFLRLGANDYVTKPFDFPVVLARVQTQLALKRSVERIVRLEQSLAQRNAELEEANRCMKRDLETAAKVQAALLPREVPAMAGADFAWQFKPCTELAGDLLNIVPLGERRFVSSC